MDRIMKDLTAIATAIIGVAIIAVLVREGSNTAGVIKAASGGFASALSTAMTGNAPTYSF